MQPPRDNLLSAGDAARRARDGQKSRCRFHVEDQESGWIVREGISGQLGSAFVGLGPHEYC